MKGFPPELLFILAFAAMMLYQYATKQSRKREPPESIQEEVIWESREDSPPDIPEGDEATWLDSPPPRASGYQLPPPEPQSSPSAIPRRRFSRSSLMGNRRDVQNAIVIAAIVGPCRAFEPHDVR